MKQFSEFLSEVMITTAITKNSKALHEKIPPEHLKVTHTPLSSSSFTGNNGEKYHVTYARNALFPSWKDRRVFVHHEDKNGKFSHVGTIAGGGTATDFNTTETGLHKKHQGHKVMTEAYKHLMLHHGLKLKSSDYQSPGGNKIWKELQKDKRFNVKEHGDDPDESYYTAEKK